ncbi:MAG TPA: hypothetical protein VE863_01850 [Pyrinomonadaceae bacterium]|jgi:hypothetical protein|nr:hypothetical protein [Pyrinomonadaceae bacterium]
MFLTTTLKAIFLGIIAILFSLNRLARAFPQVGWLQIFSLPVPQISEQERVRRRRAGNRQAGLEIILGGFILPLIYFGSTMLFFNEPETRATILVLTISILCVLVGVFVLVRNLR